MEQVPELPWNKTLFIRGMHATHRESYIIKKQLDRWVFLEDMY
jgi:hypothetical protein